MLRTLLQSLTKMCSSAMPRQGTQRGDGRAPPPKSSLWHAWLVRADSLDRCRTDRLLDPCCTQAAHETERHGSKYRNEDIIIYIILRPAAAVGEASSSYCCSWRLLWRARKPAVESTRFGGESLRAVSASSPSLSSLSPSENTGVVAVGDLGWLS